MRAQCLTFPPFRSRRRGRATEARRTLSRVSQLSWSPARRHGRQSPLPSPPSGGPRPRRAREARDLGVQCLRPLSYQKHTARYLRPGRPHLTPLGAPPVRAGRDPLPPTRRDGAPHAAPRGGCPPAAEPGDNRARCTEPWDPCIQRSPAVPAPGFARGAAGAPHLLAPVKEALALWPHVEQRPHPLAQLLNRGFARHVLNGARLGAINGANLDPHLGA